MFEKEEQVPLVECKERKKANGDVFCEVRRMPDNSFIATHWIGLQSLETVMMGSKQALAMLQEKPCKGLLDSNRELVGPWETAAGWLVQKWVPQAKALSLRYYAYVLAPGIYGQLSFNAFYHFAKHDFEIKVFGEEAEAEAWLQEKTR